MDDDVRTQRADWELEDRFYLDREQRLTEQFGDLHGIYREQFLPLKRTWRTGVKAA